MWFFVHGSWAMRSLQGTHRILGWATALSLAGLAIWLAVSFVRPRLDPLWRIDRAFEGLEVPPTWELAEERKEEGSPFFGEYPLGTRTYVTSDSPTRACAAASNGPGDMEWRDPYHSRGAQRRAFALLALRCRLRRVGSILRLGSPSLDLSRESKIEIDLPDRFSDGRAFIELVVSDTS